MQKSQKSISKTSLEQIKKRQQTISLTSEEYNLHQNAKKSKTGKAQLILTKSLKRQFKFGKNPKILQNHSKKVEKAASLASNEIDSTPKKLQIYNTNSESKKLQFQKFYYFSSIETPKRINSKKKIQECSLAVKQEKNKQVSQKDGLANNRSKGNFNHFKLTLNSQDLHNQQVNPSNYQSKKQLKTYQKDSQNYDIYYNEGEKKILTPQKPDQKTKWLKNNQLDHQESLQIKQKSTNQTLRIARNARSPQLQNQISDFKKKGSQQTLDICVSNRKNPKKINSQVLTDRKANQYFLSSENKFKKIFSKCNLVLEIYSTELERFKTQNDSLKRQNQFLKNSINRLTQ